jgi:hypothetical protein
MGNFSRTAWHYFSEMQGAASATVGGSTVVWTSSSYGPIGDSHLHVVRAPPSSTIDLVKEKVNVFRFPPGLEDLHIERWTAGYGYMWDGHRIRHETGVRHAPRIFPSLKGRFFFEK